MMRVKKTLNPGLQGNDAEKLNRDLHKRIVGQDEAIQQIVSIYQTFIAGMNSPGRPIGNLLFLGPTGTGKTRLVESVAESMLGDSRAVIKIDCAEFQHSHEIAKLIGSPPGYLGHRETHPLLSQEVLNQYHTDRFKVSFVLFDEIEKASDALWNLLLGILDKATLTLGDNRRVDFSRTMIFMTSNLGAAEMGSILRPNLGFSGFDNEHRATTGRTDGEMGSKISRAAVEAARRKFSPEFINRIDKVIVFKPLGSSELNQILTLELNQLQQRIFNAPNSTPFIFNVSASAKQFLLQEGTDLKYGARHLKRAIERNVVHAFSNLVASSQIRAGDLILVDRDAELGTLSFVKEAEDLPAYAMVQMIDTSVPLSAAAMAMNQESETPRVVSARSSRR